ncbi:MAG: DNA polymerase I, partial [Anaerolineaceae bacterium]|nr:DNA polymerase I [Anaerolineaceae bacterium]
EIHREAGREFNVDSPKQLAEVLFDEIGLKPVRKTKTGFSTDSHTLEALASQHPLPAKVLAYRTLAKLKGTYIDALPELINPDTGRIHASFNQAAVATGRLSSSNPNLQNIPIRTEEGRQIRAAFIPGDTENDLLLSADYSQVELRLLAHFSQDPFLLEAFENDLDIHAFVAAEVFGVPQSEVTAEQRARAKAVNFSLIYGKTAYGLGRDLGLSVGQAQDFIDAYFARYTRVREFMIEVLEGAKKDGYVSTILGRRRPTPGVKHTDARRWNNAERAAFNTVLQGSAADLIKVAMNNIDRRITDQSRPSRLILQVHDELVFEVPRKAVQDEREMIVEEMTTAIALKVPMKVDVSTGSNWREAK